MVAGGAVGGNREQLGLEGGQSARRASSETFKPTPKRITSKTATATLA